MTAIRAPARPRLWLGIAALVVAAGPGCREGSTAGASRGPGWYRAVLEIDPAAGAELPFFLYLPAGGEPGVLLNDGEKVPIEHRWRDRQVEISLVNYEWTIRAELDGQGDLVGRLVATHPVYKGELRAGETEVSLPLRARQVARPDPAARFALEGSGPPADFAGSWRIVPETPLDHSASQGVVYKAVLAQQAGEVRGDLIIDTGDLRFLGGNARGGSLALGTIDGSHFALLRATLEGPDRMTGELYLMRNRSRFVGERRTDLSYTDVQRPLGDVDLTGWEVPALAEERYRGKPVIVEIFGTWCTNCNDAVAMLGELYRTYHPQGLEVLGLAVEFTDDPAYAKRLVDRYAKRHQVPWQLVAITGDEQLGALLVPFDPDSFSVPITLFVRRDGKVAGGHRGYVGPTGGPDHAALRAEFERLTRTIVEPAGR